MKKCPKCGEIVSCRRWMYCDKMCRKCSGRMRARKKRREELNKKS